MRGSPCSTLTGWPGNRDWIALRPRVKPKRTGEKNQ